MYISTKISELTEKQLPQQVGTHRVSNTG